jgi:hypothetical protein
MDSRFAMIPLTAIADRRHTLRTLKVFAAICSFRRDSADYCVEAGRDEIASRCGFNASVVSTVTTELQRLGWLVKHGAGGRATGGGGLKTTYEITIPETVSTPGTVTESETVLKHETVAELETVPESATTTVSTPGTPLYKKEVNTEKVVSDPDGFSEFWDAYGKKDGKVAAIAQWKKLNPNAALVSEIIASAKRYSATTERRFRKDPERWIRDRRWEDEPVGAQSADAEDSLFAGAL